MKYTSEYIGQVTKKLGAAGNIVCPVCAGSGKKEGKPCSNCDGKGKVPSMFIKKYIIEVDLKPPPMIEQMRAMDEAGATTGNLSVDSKDNLTHHAIIGKEVKISYDGNHLGAFISNNLSDPWDNFPVLAQNPTALRLLYDLVVSFVMEKWLPPQTSTPPATAQTGAPKP